MSHLATRIFSNIKAGLLYAVGVVILMHWALKQVLRK